MKRAIPLIFFAVARVSPMLAAPAQIHAVRESVVNRSTTAASAFGQTYVAAREMRVNLNLPSGESSTGKLSILYAPSSGFFYHRFEIERHPTERSWIEELSGYSRIGVTAYRMVVIGFVNGAYIEESTEKASSLDEAEEKSINWIGDHMSNVEARSYKTHVLPADRSSFPKGFFQSEYDARPGLPVKLTELEWLEGDFILTLESTERTPEQTKEKPPTVKFRISQKTPGFPGWSWGIQSMDQVEK